MATRAAGPAAERVRDSQRIQQPIFVVLFLAPSCAVETPSIDAFWDENWHMKSVVHF
jgi:hypothetical protein